MSALLMIPVRFDSLKKLLQSTARACGRDSSLMMLRKQVRRVLRAGDTLRLVLSAPELTVPLHVDALVLARTVHPPALRVRYRLTDIHQAARSLGQDLGPRLAEVTERQRYAALNCR